MVVVTRMKSRPASSPRARWIAAGPVVVVPPAGGGGVPGGAPGGGRRGAGLPQPAGLPLRGLLGGDEARSRARPRRPSRALPERSMARLTQRLPRYTERPRPRDALSATSRTRARRGSRSFSARLAAAPPQVARARAAQLRRVDPEQLDGAHPIARAHPDGVAVHDARHPARGRAGSGRSTRRPTATATASELHRRTRPGTSQSVASATGRPPSSVGGERSSNLARRRLSRRRSPRRPPGAPGRARARPPARGRWRAPRRRRPPPRRARPRG